MQKLMLTFCKDPRVNMDNKDVLLLIFLTFWFSIRKSVRSFYHHRDWEVIHWQFLFYQENATTFRATFGCNQRIMQINVKYTKNKTSNSTMMNLQARNFKKIDNFFINFEFKLPDSPSDREFKKILLRTEVNAKSALNGDFDSPISEAIVRQMMKSFNFTLKLPFMPVNVKKDQCAYSANLNFSISI